MDGRAQALVELARQLVERALQGPLSDHKRVVTNLRYIREQLKRSFGVTTLPRPTRTTTPTGQEWWRRFKLSTGGWKSWSGASYATTRRSFSTAWSWLNGPLLLFPKTRHEIEDMEGVAENTL